MWLSFSPAYQCMIQSFVTTHLGGDRFGQKLLMRAVHILGERDGHGGRVGEDRGGGQAAHHLQPHHIFGLRHRRFLIVRGIVVVMRAMIGACHDGRTRRLAAAGTLVLSQSCDISGALDKLGLRRGERHVVRVVVRGEASTMSKEQKQRFVCVPSPVQLCAENSIGMFVLEILRLRQSTEKASEPLREMEVVF